MALSLVTIVWCGNLELTTGFYDVINSPLSLSLSHVNPGVLLSNRQKREEEVVGQLL